jgi:hypothetical protein
VVLLWLASAHKTTPKTAKTATIAAATPNTTHLSPRDLSRGTALPLLGELTTSSVAGAS